MEQFLTTRQNMLCSSAIAVSNLIFPRAPSTASSGSFLDDLRRVASSLQAEFLGVAQLLIYAGGIVVLFLFVVMLVELTKYQEKGIFQTQTKFAIPLLGLGLLTFAGVFRGALFGASAPEALTLQQGLVGATENLGNAQAVSRGLFANFLLPFEILSVILLVALVGAIVLAKSERV